MSTSIPPTPPSSRSLPDGLVLFPRDPSIRGHPARAGWITDANGCDIWQANRGHGGYGLVTVDGRVRLAHRVRYEREIGPISEGMELDHYVCNNGHGGCCNPSHCRPVTHRENMLRGNGVAAVNATKTHCPKGHPLSGENLDKSDLAKGERRCRICHNARQRGYYHAKREGSSAA